MLLGSLGLCMIQIWPLWLKIGVWWCSVTFLTTFGVLCVVRLILFCLMWIVGEAMPADHVVRSFAQPARRSLALPCIEG